MAAERGWTMDDRAEADRKANEAIQAKMLGNTWQQVADMLGYWTTGEGALMAVKRFRQRQIEEGREGLEVLRQQAAERLDFLRRHAYGVMMTPHQMYYQGGPVFDQQGRPVLDDAPRLAAVEKALKIEAEWNKLFGVYASEKLEVALKRRDELEASIVVDAILAGFDAADLPADKRMAALEAAQSHLLTAESAAGDGA